MPTKVRCETVRLAIERVPFRDGSIRIGLKPFPRRRKDGSYKPFQQTATAYLVFADNASCLFNAIFDDGFTLPDGSALTEGELHNLDRGVWRVLSQYGQVPGRWIPATADRLACSVSA